MAVIRSRLNSVLVLIALGLLIGGIGGGPLSLFGVGYGPVMSLGVSDDGHFAISSHRDNRLVLWDLKTREKEVLSDNANIYSAYFVPGHRAFLWQDLEDTVHVQTVDGEILKRFKHFPTYGHAMDHSLEHYLSANETWNLFHGHGETLVPLLRDSDSPSLMGSHKLLNLGLSNAGFFVTAGKGQRAVDTRPISQHYPTVRPKEDLRFSSNYAGVVLWSYRTLKPVAKFQGNSSKTHATISPDGQWVISGDENGNGFSWNTDAPERRHRLASYHFGIYDDELPDGYEDSQYFNDDELIEAPSGATDTTIAQAFIHNSDYFLRFGNRSHYAALFRAGDPWPRKYFHLGDSPELVTQGSQYARNTAIATAPAAGILVMGHRSGGGISVYRFDPEALTLERIWVVE